MVNLNVLLLSAVLSATPNSDTVLLQFTASGCRPCRQMVPTVQRLEQEGYPIQPIDIDRHPQAARDWGVEAVPCFILTRNGQEVDRLVGPASHDRLVRLFERVGAVRSPASQTAPPPGTIVRGQSPDPDRIPTGTFGRDQRSGPPPSDRFAALGNPQARRADAREPRPAGSSATQAEEVGFAASVRIRVNDGGGTSYGTGTIIDTHEDEALVVTCGHLFRDSQGKGETLVELLVPDAEGRVVPGHVLAWDADDRDIALLVIRPGLPVKPAPVAASLVGVQRGTPVFSVGCNHGGRPTLVRSTVAAVDRYTNAPNIVVAGQPVDGRSGGGLFTREGELIGICNAADPTDDEGIYASLPTIHEQLDAIGLSRIHQSRGGIAAASGDPGSLRREVPARPPMDDLHDVEPTVGQASSPPQDSSELPDGVPLSDLIAALENGHEVICVIRTPNAKEARVVFLDEQSRQLLSRLAPTHEPAGHIESLDEKTASKPVPTQWRD